MKRSLEDVIFGLSMSAQDYAVLAIEYKQQGKRTLYLDCVRLYNMTTKLIANILEDDAE